MAIIITAANTLSEAQAPNICIFLQDIMLLASTCGLTTCPQVSWTFWHKALHAALELSEH